MKSYFVKRIDGTLWVDGVQKKRAPSWVAMLPSGNIVGYVIIDDDGNVEWRPQKGVAQTAVLLNEQLQKVEA